MFDQKEHQPGDRAPATAHYEELNVFGSPTGSVADVRFHRHRAALRGEKKPRESLGTAAG